MSEKIMEVTGTICGAWFGFTMVVSEEDIECCCLDLEDLNNREMRNFLLDDFSFNVKLVKNED